MTRLEFSIRQIEAARRDTLSFLKDIDEADWFRQPFEGANHIAWQIGHLTVAEYGLTMGEALDRRIQDVDWISKILRSLFKRGSAPRSDPAAYPAPVELRAMLDRVHDHVLSELPGLADEKLDEPVRHVLRSQSAPVRKSSVKQRGISRILAEFGRDSVRNHDSMFCLGSLEWSVESFHPTGWWLTLIEQFVGVKAVLRFQQARWQPRDFRGFPSATGHGTSRPQNSPDFFTPGLDGADSCIYNIMSTADRRSHPLPCHHFKSNL